MLVRFKVQNYLSFYEETDFSMVAGPAKLLDSHTYELVGLDERVLKTGVIYGANGSGKSNLIKAIRFGKYLVQNGVKANASINVTPFKLNKDTPTLDSKFEYEFILDDQLYSYGIAVDSKHIKEEWLVQILKTTEKYIFHRKTSDSGEVTVDFPKYQFKNTEERQFLKFVAQGTRANQPFLTEANDRNVDFFKPIFSWFSEKLIFIFPDMLHEGIKFALDKSDKITDLFAKYLDAFDTGISSIETKEVDIEQELPKMPTSLIDKITSSLKSDTESVLLQSPGDKFYSICKDKLGKLKAKKLVTKHEIHGTQDKVVFEVSEESDGTRRILDFIPALLNLTNGDVTILIDEIDQSLHPSLTRKIFEVFHLTKSKNAQLIATTHESSLLDLELLRRDEIWFIQRDKNGASRAYSLEEYKPRHDKDIRKGYLMGRYGAIPILHSERLGWN
jgi:AAA15 family ATPase/GTPase